MSISSKYAIIYRYIELKNPSKNMRFVWKIQPAGDNRGLHTQEVLSGSVEKTGEHQENLKHYLEAFDKRRLDQKERADFRKQLEQWDLAGSVDAIRRGGVEEKQNLETPLERHIRLASEFLEPTGTPLTFKVDFRGNQLAYYKVGAADMLPPNVTVITVKKIDGSTLRGERRINPDTGRIGYYDESNSYIPVYTGDEITIETTGSMPAMGSPASMKEHMEIYGKNQRGYGATDDRASEAPEKLYDARTRTVHPNAPAALQAQRREAQVSARGQLASMRAELSPEAPQSPETAELRSRLVATALSYLDPEKGKFFHNEHYLKNPVYLGGKVGCAITASTILKESGNVNFTNPGVNYTELQLRSAGWTGVTWRPGLEQPGDVLIWRRNGPNRPDGKPGDEIGRHIGIIVGPNQVVHNARKEGEKYHHPHKTAIAGYDKFQHSGTITIWRQPGYMSARPTLRPTAAPQPEVVRSAPPGHPQHRVMRAAEAYRNIMSLADEHNQNANRMEILPQKQQMVNRFVNIFQTNRARYERIAQATDMPPALIAAIHNRESGMRFNTYLHNGQPLGKVTTIVPKGIFFRADQWEEAAIDALTSQKQLQKNLGIHRDTTDMGKLMAFAEAYNGFGYRTKPNAPSPYVYSGTNMYSGGLYVADGRYSTTATDKGIGVAAMLAGAHSKGLA